MPIFDLKRAKVRFKDGTSLLGAINNSSGYLASGNITTIVVNGFVGITPTGSLFTIGIDTTQYTVVSHVETSGNTTGITFTPKLAVDAPNSTAINVGPNYLDIRIGTGTFSWNEKRPRDYKLDRGLIYQVRDGDQVPMDVKTGFLWETLRSNSGDIIPTPYEVLKRVGPAASWLGTNPDPCAPYCIDIQILNAPNCPNINGEIYTFPQFMYEDIAPDAKTSEIAVTGKCNSSEPIIVRALLDYTKI